MSQIPGKTIRGLFENYREISLKLELQNLCDYFNLPEEFVAAKV